MNKTIIGIIPARGGSKAIPKKNMKLLLGKPLIVWSIEESLRAKRLDDLYVSTDSEDIASICTKYGCKVIYRPAEFAQDASPTWQVMLHAFDYVENERKFYDAGMVLQPTTPLRTAKDIDNAIGLFLNSDCDSLVSVVEIPHKYNPYWIKIIAPNGYIAFWQPEGKTITQRQKLPGGFYVHNGQIWISLKNTIREKKSIYGDKCVPYIMKEETFINIDSNIDFKICEALLREREHEIH